MHALRSDVDCRAEVVRAACGELDDSKERFTRKSRMAS